MSKNVIPAAVRSSIQNIVDSYGDGFVFLGHSDGYSVYSYCPVSEPEIGAIRILYKEGELPVVLHGQEALGLVVI